MLHLIRLLHMVVETGDYVPMVSVGKTRLGTFVRETDDPRQPQWPPASSRGDRPRSAGGRSSCCCGVAHQPVPRSSYGKLRHFS
jgi:hypothetical protein